VSRIVIVQGHPDPAPRRFGRALAEAYAHGAEEAGHEVTTIEVARLDFPLLRNEAEWRAAPPASIRRAQEAIAAAGHLVIVFPLWLGDMPALLKGFLEQAMRPGFAMGPRFKKLLKGRSARIVVTMGMPGFFYRLVYRAHSVKSLRRNILEFCGVSPVRTTIVGTIESRRGRARALAAMAALGRRAA
jgi:putative NADPH-quinone reductase